MTDTSSTNHSRRSQETRIHSKLVAPQATLYGDHVSGGGATHTLPYRVQLDSGAAVLAHRDEHWLVRDYALQAEGQRQGAGGARCLARMERREVAEGEWQRVDHQTRQVRSCAPPESDSEEE
mmetsp:Transcript_42992/g.139510  ORF Transcript_42992/g.139510 Transcript_42992/m.139510 type:complete len:122 (+) Transcript_42992:91-456(+)